MNSDKVAVTAITGAGGALGSQLAEQLLSLGQKVVLIDRPQAAARLEQLAATAPDRALALPLDVSQAEQWQAALPRIRERLGIVTGAALIAGGWGGGQDFHESSEQLWSQMIERNLDTTRASLRALVAEMIVGKGGSVVVIGARPAVRPWEGQHMAEYTASKAAVLALAQAVAAEVVDRGVRVNAVMPSTLDTPANRASMPDADFSRWVSLPALCRVIAFLLGDDARDVSGATIPVYGRA